MYKSFRAGPIYIPWYASPRFQLVMVAFVCFLCPGMFNALSGLGGGGLKDKTIADEMVLLSFILGSWVSSFDLTIYRTSRSTVPSPVSVSLPVPSSTGLGSSSRWPLAVLDIVSTPSACSSPNTNVPLSVGSIFSPVLCLVFARVSCGRPKALSCCPTPMRRRKVPTLLGSGVSSTLALAWEVWYVSRECAQYYPNG